MTPETLELFDRINDLIGKHDVPLEDRRRIREAFNKNPTWDSLPQEIRDLIERLERELPLQSWDDPMDVPDDLDALTEGVSRNPERR